MTVAAMTKSERAKIANVLYDADVEKIWFQLGDLRIDGKHLAAVAGLINANTIRCFRDVPDSIMKGRSAQYKYDKDALLFNTQFNWRQLDTIMQSAIVHESVHAWIDYRKAKETTVFHNEAAAYVTQALFLRNKKTTWPVDVINDPIIKAVEALIDKFKMTGNRAWLQWALFEPLMRAIQDHPTYRMEGDLKMPWDTKTPANGIATAGSPDGLINKRALAASQRGPMGLQTDSQSHNSRKRGPLGMA